MDDLRNKNIALFFSYNVSLKVWNDSGVISRESRIWNMFSKKFRKVYFITYGDKSEYEYLACFPREVNLIYNKWNLNPLLYSILVPFLYGRELWKIDIYKVNQVSGSFPAIISKILYRKKLVIRCGYQMSLFFKNFKKNKIKLFFVYLLEKIAFFFADYIFVATSEDKKYIVNTHRIMSERITVIPNGVDTERFNIISGIDKEKGRILFVGRLCEQKNLFSLLDAVKQTSNSHLVIIGSGYLKSALAEKASRESMNVTFVDNLDNDKLPEQYNKAQVFILPSFFEGNPKVLLEAMACGLAVVGTDITGINNIIRDGISGILCKTDTESIKNSFSRILFNEELIRILGLNARGEIERKFQLGSVISREVEILSKKNR